MDQKQLPQTTTLFQERELYHLVDTIPQAVWIARSDGTLEYANSSWHEYSNTLLGYTQEFPFAHIAPEDKQAVMQAWERAVQTGTLFETECRIRSGTGKEEHWALLRAVPMKDSQGRALRWLGMCITIDDRKQVERALSHSQEYIHHLMDSGIIGIFQTEGDVVVEANDTFLHMTGYSQDDVAQRRVNWMDMTPPEYKAITQYSHQELETHATMTPYEKEY